MCVLDPLPLCLGELVKVGEAGDGDGDDGDDGDGDGDGDDLKIQTTSKMVTA